MATPPVLRVDAEITSHPLCRSAHERAWSCLIAYMRSRCEFIYRIPWTLMCNVRIIFMPAKLNPAMSFHSKFTIWVRKRFILTSWLSATSILASPPPPDISSTNVEASIREPSRSSRKKPLRYVITAGWLPMTNVCRWLVYSGRVFLNTMCCERHLQFSFTGLSQFKMSKLSICLQFFRI